MMMHETICRWIAALALASAGCGASHPPPTDNLASAIAAVRAAQEAGAAEVPKASLQLKLAQEQVAQARAMMQDGEHERADYMTLRAFNDAELARALAREHEAREAVQEAKRNATRGETPNP